MRSRPMKVLVLGLGRTGTTALAEALKAVGFSTYDYPDRFWNNHLQQWNEAMQAKLGVEGQVMNRPVLTRNTLDELTGDYDCILDVPCCFFAEELCRAYPEAKVILNYRNVDEWIRSVQGTIFKVQQWPSLQFLRYLHSGIRKFSDHNDLIWKIFCNNEYQNYAKLRQGHEEHYSHIRRVVTKDRLLEYHIKEGWEPLVKFLDLEPRSGPLPAKNGTAEFLATFSTIWWFVVWRSLKRAAIGATLVLGLGILLMYWRVLLVLSFKLQYWLKEHASPVDSLNVVKRLLKRHGRGGE